MLDNFGWPREAVIDLGGIDVSRAMEMFLPLWIRLMMSNGGARFNIQVAR